MRLLTIIVILVFTLNYETLVKAADEQEFAPIITTNSGRVRGVVIELNDATKVNLYEGIPYAEPPVGALRFDKPKPARVWTDVYKATLPKNACMQTPFPLSPVSLPPEAPESEDCLFLNVWLPSIRAQNNKTRSVMVWIHGGAFSEGTIFSFVYDARYIAALGDVIVVTVNYRLGPFGFLYGGTNDTEGNAALYDQILAIKWVKDNIAAFGGDPQMITVFGESAGGMSVGSLILSPLTSGLFQRAIMQSGAPNVKAASQPKQTSIAKTKSLANKVNCTRDLPQDMMNCLRAIDAKVITQALKNATLNETFQPIYGDEVLPIKPYDALKTGHFNHNLSLLFGTVSNEGSIFAEKLLPEILNPELIDPNISISLANDYIQFVYQVFQEPYGKEAANFYLTNLTNNDKDSLRRAIEFSLGDYLIACPTALFGLTYAQSNNQTYGYRFSYPPSVSGVPLCGSNGRWMDVCHSEDVLFLFGFPIKLHNTGFNETDYRLSVDTINAWTTFAKTGKPAKMNNTDWIEAIDRNSSSPTIRVMDMNPNSYKIVDGLYKNSCEDFWRKIFDKN